MSAAKIAASLRVPGAPGATLSASAISESRFKSERRDSPQAPRDHDPSESLRAPKLRRRRSLMLRPRSAESPSSTMRFLSLGEKFLGARRRMPASGSALRSSAMPTTDHEPEIVSREYKRDPRGGRPRQASRLLRSRWTWWRRSIQAHNSARASAFQTRRVRA